MKDFLLKIIVVILLIMDVFTLSAVVFGEVHLTPNTPIRKAQDAHERSVTIKCEPSSGLKHGDSFVLVCELHGFGKNEVTYQWQLDNGTGWTDIEGATRKKYKAVLTRDAATSTYRVVVTKKEDM